MGKKRHTPEEIVSKLRQGACWSRKEPRWRMRSARSG
jgi:hypothetical protein